MLTVIKSTEIRGNDAIDVHCVHITYILAERFVCQRYCEVHRPSIDVNASSIESFDRVNHATLIKCLKNVGRFLRLVQQFHWTNNTFIGRVKGCQRRPT